MAGSRQSGVRQSRVTRSGWAGPGAGGGVRKRFAADCGQGRPRGSRAERTSMPVAASAQVHPTAIVSPDAVVGEGVRIGPYSIVEGPVTIGPDCVLAPHVHLVGPLVLGSGNRVGTGTVIGTDPQHLAYTGQPSRTEIGDFNTFREYV